MKEFTPEELRAMVPKLSHPQKTTMAFYDGDAWQNGQGWIGPSLAPADPNYGDTMNEIRRLFTSQNIIREVVDRVVAGLVSITPEWTVTVTRELADGEEPAEDEQERIDEAENLLQRWWDRDQGLAGSEDMLWSPIKIFRRALALSLQIGRAPLRMFLPVERWMGEDEGALVTLPTLTPDQAVESVFVHLPEAIEADVHINHKTLEAVGVYTTRDESNSVFHELHSLDGRMSTIQQYKNFSIIGETKLDLNGHPTMIEVGMPELIDESIRSQQRSVNMILTMLARNTVQAGFLERVILNGQLPGEERIDPVTGEVRFTPTPFAIGPGRTAFIPGIETENADGTVSYASPSISYRDPVSTETFVGSVTHLYRQILHSVHQEHVFQGAGADASGESRKQARADFEMILSDNSETVRMAIQWMLETAMHLIGLLSGQAGRYNDLTVNVEVHTYSGPLSAQERDSDIRQVDAKIISKRTARIRSGVHNPELEERQILDEQEMFGDSEMATLAALLRQPAQSDVDMPPMPPDGVDVQPGNGTGAVMTPGGRQLAERVGDTAN